MKVTLPLAFIYRNDIFDAINTVFASLYEQSKQTRGKNIPYQGFHRRLPEHRGELRCIWRITYHGIYEMVTDILHKKISDRDLKLHLDKLVKDQELKRIEDKNSNRNLKPTYYIRTEKARMRHRLKIQHEIIGKREQAYHLLTFYCAFKNAPVMPLDYDRNILEDDKSLEEFLSKEFSLTKDDFIVDSTCYNRDLYSVTL